MQLTALGWQAVTGNRRGRDRPIMAAAAESDLPEISSARDADKHIAGGGNWLYRQAL